MYIVQTYTKIQYMYSKAPLIAARTALIFCANICKSHFYSLTYCNIVSIFFKLTSLIIFDYSSNSFSVFLPLCVLIRGSSLHREWSAECFLFSLRWYWWGGWGSAPDLTGRLGRQRLPRGRPRSKLRNVLNIFNHIFLPRLNTSSWHIPTLSANRLSKL